MDVHHEPPHEPIEIPWGRRVDDFRRELLPWIVWAGVLLICLWMLGHRYQTTEYIGLAQAVEVQVAVVSPGVVKELYVGLFDTVDAGQALAMLDSTRLEARIATLRAEVEQLQAELKAEASRLSAEMAAGDRAWNAEARQETQLRFDVLELRVTLETDRIEAQRLELELERARRLLAENVISQAEVDLARLESDRLGERIARNEELLASTLEELTALSERRQAAEAQSPDSEHLRSDALEALRLAAEVQTRRLEELEVERRSLVLRASIDGRIQKILAGPGQTVLAGQPVMLLVADTAADVVVYLPDGQDRALEVDDRVRVSTAERPGVVAEAVVESLAPKIDTLPNRLWLRPDAPSFGRSARLSPVPDLELLPGQRVRVHRLP